MGSLTGLVDIVQEAIDKGTRSVEVIHKAILDQPFNVIEKIAPLEGPAKKVRAIQDRTIGTVYGVIHTVNAEVGKFAKDLLASLEKPKVS